MHSSYKRLLWPVIAVLAAILVPTATAQVADDAGVRYHPEPLCILPGIETDAFAAHRFTPKRSKSQSATITVLFDDGNPSDVWPADATNAFRFAADIWESHISSPVTLYVRAYWDNIGSPLASGGPATSASDFPDAEPNTKYPLALYRAMTGAPLPPPFTLAAQADMLVTINSAKPWSYTTDGKPVSGQYDLVTVAIHEIGHGLGFIGTPRYNNSIGELGNPPFIYDRFVVDWSGNPLLDENAYTNPSTELGDAFTGGALRFEDQASTDGPTHLYAPAIFSSGTSYAHLDYAAYPPGSINSSMNPFVSTAEVQHRPGPATCNMLQSMGWTLAADCLLALPIELSDFRAVVDRSDVLLNWTTLAERDNSGFEIQRHHGDGTFQAEGFVHGQGTSDHAQRYSFRVKRLTVGRHRFRLKQIDFDGTFSYSPEIEVAVETPTRFDVSAPHPNPFQSMASFEARAPEGSAITLRVYDVLGRTVQEKSYAESDDGALRLTIDGSRLAPGVYYYRVSGSTFSRTGSLVRN